MAFPDNDAPDAGGNNAPPSSAPTTNPDPGAAAGSMPVKYPNTGNPLFFDEGGPVDGDDDANTGTSLQDSINAALETVDNALSYGRKLHGLGGDQQEASARTPMIPGNQSESGIKPLQPSPGPLPATDNPFGKRTSRPPMMSQNDKMFDDDADDEGAA